MILFIDVQRENATYRANIVVINDNYAIVIEERNTIEEDVLDAYRGKRVSWRVFASEYMPRRRPLVKRTRSERGNDSARYRAMCRDFFKNTFQDTRIYTFPIC